jgi:hypothetical protein
VVVLNSLTDRHPQCDGKVTLCCKQELHSLGVSGVLKRKNQEDSNLATVQNMYWFPYSQTVMTQRTFRTIELRRAGTPPLTFHVHSLGISGTCSSSFGKSCKRSLGSGCLRADAAKHAGLPDDHQ